MEQDWVVVNGVPCGSREEHQKRQWFICTSSQGLFSTNCIPSVAPTVANTGKQVEAGGREGRSETVLTVGADAGWPFSSGG